MSRTAAASTRVVESVSEPPSASSETSVPLAAPIARALRIVSGAVAPAIETRWTSPPCASVSLRAASSAYSSFALTTAGTAARSRRKSAGRRRSPPDAVSGTGFTRTTIRTSRAVSVRCCGGGSGRSALARQGPGDDQPLDLLGSLVELGDLGVAHHPLDRELVDVAVPAEHLHGIGRHPHRGVAGDEF